MIPIEIRFRTMLSEQKGINWPFDQLLWIDVPGVNGEDGHQNIG